MAAKTVRPICIIGKTAFVLLTQGKVAVIDAADVHLVQGRNWFTARSRSTFYARTNTPRLTKNAAQGFLLLHRVIMDAPDHLQVDHEDGDGLNCRRSNMRLATNAQNGMNKRRVSATMSGKKGVTWHCRQHKWNARIMAHGVMHNLGSFSELADAKAAYDLASKRLHGQFSRN